MRGKFSLAVAALCMFAALFSFVGASATESGATTLTATAAFYVSGWSGDVDKNMSGDDYIMVSTATNDPKKAYIEFEIPALTTGFDSATLTLFHREASNSSLKAGVGYEFRLCETNGYDIDTVTWNNASESIIALSDVIGSGVVSDEDVASGSISIELYQQYRVGKDRLDRDVGSGEHDAHFLDKDAAIGFGRLRRRALRADVRAVGDR